MSKFLFLFTIGPVQSFIAQARKTHDLYAGSRILSELTGHAIKSLPSESELLFPTVNMESVSDEKGWKSIPNEFLAIIKCNNPREIGEYLKNEVKNKFKKIAEQAFTNSGLKIEPMDFYKHIGDFPNVYWVAVPYEGNDDYKEKYKQLTRLLGAVKNTRIFNQLSEVGRKCSLCGERNALFYRPNLDKDGNKKKPKYLDDDAKEIDNFRLEHGEGLCGICFTKRFYIKEKEFPSTAAIAIDFTLQYLSKKDDFKALFDEYKELLGNSFDEELYYEESLTKRYFDKYGLDAGNLDKIEAINKKLRDRIMELNETEKLNLRLSRYYAIIIFDGDDMGKRLSGDGLKEGVSLQEFHRELSEKLGNFADEAQKYLDVEDEGRGRCVYAGGDDFLGFVNLRHLFEVMSELRTSFDEKVNIPLKENFLNDNINLTFSAGIVVAHYKTPLREVLGRVREMMDIAKSSNSEKDAFCMAVLKRSGEVEQAICKWDLNGLKSTDVMKAVVDALEDGSFSNTFIKQLAMEMYGLMDQEGSFITGKGLEDEILKAEIKRLVDRSYMLEKKDGQTIKEKEDKASLCNNLYKLYKGVGKSTGNGRVPSSGVKRVPCS